MSRNKGDDWVPSQFLKAGTGNHISHDETEQIAGQLLDDSNRVFGQLGVKSTLHKTPGSSTSSSQRLEMCNGCNRSISGAGLTAMGKTWHPNCFECCRCHTPIASDTFTVMKEKPWCKPCADRERQGKGGATPSKTVTRTTTTTTTTHPNGITSTQRNQIINESNKGKEACRACSLWIDGVGVQSNNGVYHEACFRCTGCHQTIPPQTPFTEDGGQPYHVNCAQDKHSEKCAKCNKAMIGKFTIAEGKKYHKECFICEQCHGALASGYILKQGQVLCKNCGQSTMESVWSVNQPGIRVDPRSGNKTIAPGWKGGSTTTTSSTTTTTSAPAPALAPAAAAAATTGKKFCTSCGANVVGCVFCGSCGTKV